MGLITISNGVTSWTGYADEKATPIWNANSSVTIGGVSRTQADTQRLKIELVIVGRQSEIAAVMAVLKEFQLPIDYTPSRILFDKGSIFPLRIAIVSSPAADIKGRDGELLYEMKIECEEVISE